MNEPSNEWPPAPVARPLEVSRPAGMFSKASPLLLALLGGAGGVSFYFGLVGLGAAFFNDPITLFEMRMKVSCPAAIFWRVPIVLAVSLFVLYRSRRFGMSMLVSGVTIALLHGLYILCTIIVEYSSPL